MFRNVIKITLLMKVLPDEAIHVFVCSSFPGSERMSKEEIYIQFAGDTFMFSELLDIISGDGI